MKTLDHEALTQCWADVKTVSFPLWNPMRVGGDEFDDELQELIPIKCLIIKRLISKQCNLQRSSLTGKATRDALRTILFMFMSGRNKVTLPFVSRYALRPSKTV